jgi:putative ABC transport system substrate-binding protein
MRHVAVGLSLILLASCILLWSDPKRKTNQAGSDTRLKVALLNYTSVPVLEDGQRGMVDGLAESGFENGKQIEIKHFNAEGDRATAVLMAKEVVGGKYQAILTLSTPMLQAVATANEYTQRTHIFTLSTDPAGAGVGIDRDDPTNHPPYMIGYGTMQPVAEIFAYARQAFPNLKKVGVVWNPAESNSEASTLLARSACKEMQIELVEATVDTAAGILDAVKAILAKDIQAIWVGGDTTVASGLDTMINTAAQAKVPVFSNIPVDIEKGAVFSLGADYYQVGIASGKLAARILNGESPAKLPVENYAPKLLAINFQAISQFKPTWNFPKNWEEEAQFVVDVGGKKVSKD